MGTFRWARSDALQRGANAGSRLAGMRTLGVRLTRARAGRLADILGADLRSLAALRIVLAMVVWLDLMGRIQHLGAHYTDQGVLPREGALDLLSPWRWSLLFINGTPGFQLALFLAGGIAAIGMLVGYHTRLMTVLVWVLIVSLQARNPLVLSAADSLLRMLLFWAIFLPLGERWSFDSQGRRGPETGTTLVVSVATVGIFAQIAFMYWFTVLLKTGDEWRSSGTALYYALGAQHLTRDLGDFLFQFESLLKVLTVATFGIEIIGPALLFAPILTGPLRTAAVFVLMALHLGIGLTMEVGVFPWISALSMVCFLPAWFWDRLLPSVRARFARAGYRQRLVAALGSFRIGQREGSRPQGSHGAEVPKTPAGAAPAGRAWPAGPFMGRAIQLVANGALVVCLLLVFGWNMATVTDFEMPERVQPIVDSLGLYQRWSMFAPYPVRATIWYEVRGTLADGTELDLLPTIVEDDLDAIYVRSPDSPADRPGDYEDKYWRKYLDEVSESDRDDERRAFMSYICGMWNGHYGGDVALVDLKFVRLHRSTLPNQERGPVEQREVSDYSCP